jgi:hypothetical protein
MALTGQPKTTAQYIQVTGRVGRRWWERPGLILTLYNPGKPRDASHFEHFHSYHRRLYERVEPTTATPFAVSAIRRALAGVLLAWARQHVNHKTPDYERYRDAIEEAYELVCDRCRTVQSTEDCERSLKELLEVKKTLLTKWKQRPLEWEGFPPDAEAHYLMLWPGQYYSRQQKSQGVTVPSSMRQVDGNAELKITDAYLRS